MGDSWHQRFEYRAAPGETFETIWLIALDCVEAPYMDAFAPSGEDWSSQLTQKSILSWLPPLDVVEATGNALTTLEFDVHFRDEPDYSVLLFLLTDPVGEPVQEYEGYYGGTFLPGSGWSFRNNGASEDAFESIAASVIPAPGAAMLVFLGIGLVGWAKRRLA